MKARRKTRRRANKAAISSQSEVRFTAQRRAVLKALTISSSHPTVRELYELTKQYSPGISLATIYNSLQALQRAGLVNEHRVTSGAARYCINKQPHVHLLDKNTGQMIDVHIRKGVKLEEVFELPEGVEISSMRAYLYGKIPS